MIGMFFTARLGSSRLPQKHLHMAGGKTFIEWLVLRYNKGFDKEIAQGQVKLILTTSEEPENKKFVEVLSPHNIDVFFGNVSNIPQRHLDCADKYRVTHIISIDGDDILCSTKGSKIVYENFVAYPGKDVIASTGLPLGMNSSGYSVQYLRKCLQNAGKQKMETGWGWIFENPDKLEIKLNNYDIYDKLRFTLDYEEDATFFSSVIDFLGNRIFTIKDEELIAVVKEQHFDKLNDHLFDTYWENFNSLKAEEQQNGKS